MPSVSYRRWATTRARLLDEVESAHAAIGGTGRGRRFATQQVNRAYAVLLAAQFQGFCRDLHDECIRAVASVAPLGVRDVVEVGLVFGRKLDRGNATDLTIREDFQRLGMELWVAAVAAEPQAAVWRRRLDELNVWRNAIAHDDFNPARLGGTIVLRLERVRRWRRACSRLAQVFDRVCAQQLQPRLGFLPW